MKCIDIFNYGVDIIVILGIIAFIINEIYQWWDWRKHEKHIKAGDVLKYNEETKQYYWIKKEL